MAVLISYSVAGSVGGSRGSFVWVSTTRITCIKGSLIHLSKQIAPNRCQAYENEGLRMKVLSLTLGFPYR